MTQPTANLYRTWSEPDRLAALYAAQILDTGRDAAFDDLVRIAAHVCQAPIALISLVDRERQWFKAEIGLGFTETSLDISVCKHALAGGDLFVVEDLAEDPRFADLAIVTGAPHLRFYAGAPLINRDGLPLGTVCVLDSKPRYEGIDKAQKETLEALARSAMAQIEMRQFNRILWESQQRYHALIAASPAKVWHRTVDGEVPARQTPQTLGGRAGGASVLEGVFATIHPEDQDAAIAEWRSCVDSGANFERDFRSGQGNGEYRWTRVRVVPLRDARSNIIEWIGTTTDIDDRKQAELALRQSEQFSKSVLESSSSAIEVVDLTGRLIFINEGGLTLFEVDDRDKVLGRIYEDFFCDEDKHLLRSAFQKARLGGRARFSVLAPTSRSVMKWWDVAVSPIFNADGTVERVLIVTSDITDAKDAETAILEASGRLSAALETTMDCVLVLDRDWRITYMNGRAIRGLDGGAGLIGRDVRDVLTEPEFLRQFAEALENGSSVQFDGFVSRDSRWLEVQAAGTTDGLTIFFRDITEQRRANEVIARQALVDALTGLPNRLSFQQSLARSLETDGVRTTLVLLDLDHFKGINDAFGHPAGDALLKAMAIRLQQVAAEQFSIARLGGDEFALIGQDPVQVLHFSQRLIEALGAPFEIDGRIVRTGVSVGIAIAHDAGTAADALFANADIALYEAKAAGGNAAREFEPILQERILAREAMKQDLAEALGNNEFEVVYQPQVALSSGRLMGFEALLRWKHPVRGNVLPVDFIPLAEETGLINPIGDWVLDQALAQASLWPEPISISVNLSPIQFRSPALPLRVMAALSRSGVMPSRLTLEITESVLLANDDCNIAMLDTFRAMGARIALDDFGTGYSSLSYLKNFAFDELKIDRSFIQDIGKSRSAEAIIQSVAQLGRALGVVTTAEGVETLVQRAWLTDAGYDQGQGYLFSRPVNAGDASRLAAKSRLKLSAALG